MKLNNTQNISVDRAINEFRSGRPITVNTIIDYWVFFTIDCYQ